jgi:hypothetical protein
MLLLGVYCAYIWFQACSNILFLQYTHPRAQLKSHPNLFIAPSSLTDEQNSETAETEETELHMGTAAAGVAYVWFRHLIHWTLILVR